MWPLRQNVQYNKQYFFKDIFIFVSVMHFILLAVLFLSESGKFHQERFVIDTKNLQSTVVFMPLQKRVTEQNAVTSGQKNNGARKVMSYDEYQKKLSEQKKNKNKNVKKSTPKKKSVPQKAAKPVEKKAIKPVEKKQPAKKSPTMLRSSSLIDKQSSFAKAMADKEKAKIAADKQKAAAVKVKALKDKMNKAAADKKKPAEKKALVDKKIAEQKALADQKAKADKEKKAAEESSYAKAMADKKKLAIEKALEDKQKIKEEHIVAAPVQKEIAVPAVPVKEEAVLQAVQEDDDSSDDEDTSNDNSDDMQEEDDLGNISFVGSRDLEMMQIKEQIQSEIIKYYKPPVGIAKKAVCDLFVLVGPGGKATRVVVKKGSGSVANDICARTALLKVVFPKEVIGK